MILVNLINNDDAFVSATTADPCSMVHLVCLFMKTHLLALLQSDCLDLVHCVLCKLSVCVRNITVFCQHLLRPIQLAVLADTDKLVKLKYWLIYQSISSYFVILTTAHAFVCFFKYSQKWALLTLWEPVYKYIVPRFQPKTSSFQLRCLAYPIAPPPIALESCSYS